MPRMEINEMDCKAGCLAKTSAPMPTTNEDTEIVSNAKDKGGQDDVDDVEFNSQNSHQSQDDYPADQHREKTHQGKFDTSV